MPGMGAPEVHLMSRPITITGRVVLSDGTNCPSRAHVALVDYNDARVGEAVEADAEGRYALPVNTRGGFVLRAHCGARVVRRSIQSSADLVVQLLIPSGTEGGASGTGSEGGSGLDRGSGIEVAGIIEDFETGDLGGYTLVGGPILGGPSASAAHDGAWGLNITDYDEFPGWVYRAENLVSEGEIISTWVRAGADGRGYVGFGSTSAGTFALAVAPNTGTYILQYVSGFTSFEEFAQTPVAWNPGQWYLLKAQWNPGGSVTSSVFASDGVTQLAGLTGMSTTFVGPSTGGIGWRGFGGSHSFDTLTDSGSTVVLIPTLSAWGAVVFVFVMLAAMLVLRLRIRTRDSEALSGSLSRTSQGGGR